MTFKEFMKEVGYDLMTTFWEDFSIADKYGIAGVKFNGSILKMVGYFRGSEKEGQVFCDMITERIEKYEQRESYNRSKLNN